ncbi:MAG: tetratricopeptide repeat protein [Deltaproteobacteria bacterium]|nr:tetratricopeptide repeat protein [Deltaproteobacteria bacterium]
MRGRSLLALAAVLALAWLVVPAKAQSPDEVLSFARHLVWVGQPEAAGIEFRRFLFLFPDDSRAPAARLDLAEACLESGRPGEARRVLFELPPQPDEALAGRAVLLLGRLEKESGRRAEAEAILARLAGDEAFSLAIRDEARYRLGWLYLEQGAWVEAGQAFSAMDPAGQRGIEAALLARDAPGGAALERKSPLGSGIMSGLLPGLGQVYLKRFSDAAWSAGLSFGPGVLSYLAFVGGSFVTGGVLAGLAVAFWAGNVYNAVNQAHQTNRRVEDQFRRQLSLALQGLGRP